MKHYLYIIVPLCLVLFLTACASSSEGRNWKENKRKREMGMPSKLKPEPEEVPAAVRRLEVQIDRPGVILAEEAVIHVSKNYEFDISLSGDDVSRDLNSSGVHESLALGAATAFVRNLKIQCDRSIRVKIADFGTKPFIKISARGHCSHIILDNATGRHEVKRARAIKINNADVHYGAAYREETVSSH